MNPLAEVLALATGVKRYRPEIEWSGRSWTHNVFRVYELLFWRRRGVRPEVMSDLATGQQWGISFEGKCAVFESKLRSILRELASIRLAVHEARIAGTPFAIPHYSFAITPDATSDGGAAAASPDLFNHTNTGSDLCLVITALSAGVFTDNSNAVTYNSVAATKRSTQNDTGSTIGAGLAIWTLQNPATGSNQVSVGVSSGNVAGRAVSFSGATGGYHTQNSGKTNSVTSISPSITTTDNNCYLVGVMSDGGSNPTIGSGYTIIGAMSNAHLAGYAGPRTPAGAHSPQLATFTSSDVVWCVVSISPTAAGGGGGTSRRLTLLGAGK